MTPYTPEEIALAEEIASDSAYITGSTSWFIRQFGALLAIRATTERAAKEADTWPGNGCEIADALRNNEHLKDRPDAK